MRRALLQHSFANNPSNMNTLLNAPLIWIPALGVILAIVFGQWAFRARGIQRGSLAIIAAVCVLAPGYLLAAAFAPQWIDARHRSYLSFYESIQPGMTRFEVLASLERHYPAEGPRQRPKTMKDSAAELGFFMNPEDSYEPNCEGIFLDFADGKVTRKRYSRD